MFPLKYLFSTKMRKKLRYKKKVLNVRRGSGTHVFSPGSRTPSRSLPLGAPPSGKRTHKRTSLTTTLV
jgi:hypothetical protein